jgi:hypothetical protein
MRFTTLFVALFATVSIATPEPAEKAENAATEAYFKLSSQKKLVMMTLLELFRRKEGGAAHESILQPLESADQLPGYLNSLAAYLPSDVSRLVNGVNKMAGSDDSSARDSALGGLSLSGILSSLGINT